MHYADPNSQARPDTSAAGATNGARYKMMSPAKLPISRSPCLTVPPGLSPGALLESPVFLTNIKAEPSPTTGTFSLYSVINSTVASNLSHSPRGTYENKVHEVGGANEFEFIPHAQGNTAQQEHLYCGQMRTQPTLEPPQSLQSENIAASSHDLTLSVTTTVPTESSQFDSNNGLNDISHNDINNSNTSSPVISAEKSSEDGYNWRKYGQKHVKGCEFPRSYYKCTHPNCQMKKQLERNHDGQITEIIYKGRHDHPKPELRKLAVGTNFTSQGETSFAGFEDKLLSANHLETNGNTELSANSVSDDDAEVGGTNNNGEEVAEDGDPESKRRKQETAIYDSSQIGKNNREPRVVVQTISEVDILDDGYRWRKYGQKVVKGNPNPRSYYKCTNAGCSVRKHVERAPHDPKAVITTYEGKHNHEVPAARNSSHDTATPSIANIDNPLMSSALNSMFRSNYDARFKGNDETSLGLGVRQVHNQEVIFGNSGNEGFSFKSPSVNHGSQTYYPSSGNLVMGP